MTAFVLRAPVDSDVEALAQLHVSTWRETYAGQVPDELFSADAVEARRRLWTSMIDEPQAGQRTVVAEFDGVLGGFASAGRPISPEEPPAPRELYMIYLARLRHGSGAGQAMLDAVLGDEPAYLWVAKQNPRARAFYARNGFHPDGHEKTHPQIPGFTELRLVR